METIELLRRHGLFDANVPRYTSYPPANHFKAGAGQRNQTTWFQAVEDGTDVSVYIHIPFCKRLCWFCACRTQGTKTLRPVEDYVQTLCREIKLVRSKLPANIRMGRLHLGGGTPTILPAATMSGLLATVFDEFTPAEGLEFSVEIDPTEAKEPLLKVLVENGMNRASIGVQDFDENVQKAIGRPQTVAQTRGVIDFLRKQGVASLNMDLLYGLPHQTTRTFRKTLEQVIALRPDRLAIYGYAHVPWMSKRQVMIKSDDLPDNKQRFAFSQQAGRAFTGAGYDPIGIDHFALPSDNLAKVAASGQLHRNFQGYTDDQSQTLIGFGASAISHFPGGYVQNATATSAYQERVLETGTAGHRGYEMTPRDIVVARMIEDLMCRFSICENSLSRDFPDHAEFIRHVTVSLMKRFPDVFFISKDGMEMRDIARPLVRVVASSIDGFDATSTAHSAAI